MTSSGDSLSRHVRIAAVVSALLSTLVVIAAPVATAADPSAPPTAAAGTVDGTDDPPPAPVTGLTARPQSSGVRLDWVLPPDTDLARVVVRRATGTVAPAGPTEGTEIASGLLLAWLDEGLDWVDTYSYSVFTQDAAGQWSTGVSRTSAALDLPPASPWTATVASPTSVRLTWDLAQDQRVAGVRIQRALCSDPSTVQETVDVPRDQLARLEEGLSRSTSYCWSGRTYDTDGRPARTARSTSAGTWAVPPVSGLTADTTTERVHLRWTLPEDPELDLVVVLRTGGPTDGDGIVVHRGGSSEYVDSAVAPETRYSYRVTTTRVGGGEGPPRSITADTALRWVHDRPAPYVGAPEDISCPTTTWCVSVDRSGRYQVLDGTAWSTARTLRPAVMSGNPQGLTCPTKGWCLAFGPDGFQRFVAGAFTAVADTPQPPTGAYTSLTCTSSTWCVAMTTDTRATVFSGGAWSPLTHTSSLRGVTWVDVACQAQGRCFAVGIYLPTWSTWRATLVNGRWTTGYLAKPGLNLAGIECPTTTWCTAAGGSGTWTVSGTTWSARAALPSGVQPERELSCASRTVCWATDWASRGIRWTGTAWSAPVTLGYRLYTITGVSCPRGTTTCHAVDDRGRHYRWTPTSPWKPVVTFDETSGFLGDISCVSASLCFGVDHNGWLHRWDGARWTRPVKLFTDPATVECLPSGFCLALQESAKLWRTYAGGVWSGTSRTPSASTLGPPSCGAPTSCMAVDGNGSAWRFTGSSWVSAGSPFASLGSSPSGDIRCVGTTWCMAVTHEGHWSRWNGASWSARAPLPADLVGKNGVQMSCVTRTACVAVVDRGDTATWDGTSWSHRGGAHGAGYRLSDVDCVSATYCIGVHPYANSTSATKWDGLSWSDTGSFPAPAWTEDVECPALRACFVRGGDGVLRTAT